MRIQQRRLTGFVLVLGLMTSLLFHSQSATVFAQAQDGTLNDLGEGENRVLTSDWQVLNPGEQITYRVVYDGNEQPISGWMNAIPADAVNFQIWTDERLEEFSEDPDTEPLGQGTSMSEGTGFTN